MTATNLIESIRLLDLPEEMGSSLLTGSAGSLQHEATAGTYCPLSVVKAAIRSPSVTSLVMLRRDTKRRQLEQAVNERPSIAKARKWIERAPAKVDVIAYDD